MIAPRPEVAASIIETMSGLLKQAGRRREDVKFFQGLSFVVGSTEEEAQRKARALDEVINDETMICHLGGAMAVALGAYSLWTTRSPTFRQRASAAYSTGRRRRQRLWDVSRPCVTLPFRTAGRADASRQPPLSRLTSPRNVREVSQVITAAGAYENRCKEGDHESERNYQ